MRSLVQRLSRGLSPVFLVLAALCFLLPFVGVSCNSSAASGALNSAASAFGGSSGSGSGAADTGSQCLNAINGKDLVTYSGINLLSGSDPSTVTDIAGCPSTGGTTASGGSQGGVGTQLLLVVAGVLILVGVVATVLRAPLRGVVAGAAALVAGVLVIVNNSNVHGVILNKITASGSNGQSLASLGVSGGLDSFFNIHAAIGFWLILAALALALVVNAAAVIAGSDLTIEHAHALPEATPAWTPPTDPPPVSSTPSGPDEPPSAEPPPNAPLPPGPAG